MIPLYEKHYFVYTGYITSPNVRTIVCGLCGKKLVAFTKRIECRGWACLKINHQVRERYCPTCTRKIWPGFYAKALAAMRGH